MMDLVIINIMFVLVLGVIAPLVYLKQTKNIKYFLNSEYGEVILYILYAASSVNGLNQIKFGTPKGVLVKIDRGTIIQQTSQGNVALYKIEVLLDKTSLSNDEEVIHVYKSMPVEARVIYQQESYFEWLLEQLNFMK